MNRLIRAVIALCLLSLAQRASASPLWGCDEPKAVYAGGNGTFGVPNGCLHMKVKVWGAGGNSFQGIKRGGAGGGGGFAHAIFPVVGGQTFWYFAPLGTGGTTPGGSGVMTTLALTSTFPPNGNTALVSAGAGGGGAGGTQGGIPGNGGAGGGSQGLPGTSGAGAGEALGGNPGTQTAPGTGGVGATCNGQSNTPSWSPNGHSVCAFAGRGGGSFFWGGDGGSALSPDGVVANGGGGGGGSSFIKTSLAMPLRSFRLPGAFNQPSKQDDPDYIQGYGVGKPAGSYTSPFHTGAGGMIAITWDEDVKVEESSYPPGGPDPIVCTLHPPGGGAPAAFTWPQGHVPPGCGNTSLSCALAFDDVEEKDVVCSYVCTDANLPDDWKFRLWRMDC